MSDTTLEEIVNGFLNWTKQEFTKENHGDKTAYHVPPKQKEGTPYTLIIQQDKPHLRCKTGVKIGIIDHSKDEEPYPVIISTSLLAEYETKHPDNHPTPQSLHQLITTHTEAAKKFPKDVKEALDGYDV